MAVTVEEMDLPRRTLMWIAGAFLSMFLFAAVIALSYTLGAREGGFGEPPFIRAAEGPYKIVPEQPGGQSFPHQKIGVYDRISGAETAMVEQLLPPSEQPLNPNLIPRTAPRVIDDLPVSDSAVVVLPVPDPNSENPNSANPNFANSEAAAPSAESAVEIETVPPIGLSVDQATDQATDQSQDLTNGRDLPPSETVAEDVIAGLIRQSTTPTPPSIPLAGNGEMEMVMPGNVPDAMPVIPQASRLEPVVAEEIMSDPARVLDGKQVPIPSARSPVPASSQPSAAPETEVAAFSNPLASMSAPTAKSPQTPELTPAELPGGEQIESVDILNPRPKPVYQPTPSKVVPEEAPGEVAKGMPQETPEDVTKVVPQETPEEVAKVAPEETSQQMAQIVPKAMPAGSFVVQIASFRKKEEAESAWRRTAKTHKDLVAQLRPSIQRADLGTRGIYYRLRIGPLENKAQAQSLCKLLKKRKLDCLVPKQ